VPTPIMTSRSVLLSFVVAIAAVGVAAGCGGNEASSASVPLFEQGGSGQSGTATFTSQGSTTSVVLALSNPPAIPQPSHIHQGTCENPNPQPAFPLDDVEGGTAETTVKASLEALRGDEDYYVNVHKSAAELETIVACGNLPDSGGGGYGGGGY